MRCRITVCDLREQRSQVEAFEGNSYFILLCVVALNVIWLNERALAVSPTRGALELASVQVIIIERTVDGQSEKVYYAPELVAIRIEQFDRVVILQLKQRQAFVIFHVKPTRATKIDFEEFGSADRAMYKYSRSYSGFDLTPPTALEKKWAVLQIDNEIQSSGKLSCYGMELVNQYREKRTMCVIRDPRVRQLYFIKEYVDRIPNHLRHLVAGSAELFLFSQGIVPINLKRRGRNLNVTRFASASMAKSKFDIDDSVTIEEFGSHYRDVYQRALQPKAEEINRKSSDSLPELEKQSYSNAKTNQR